MDRGLTVEYLYHDADIVEVQVSASNGHFAGSAAVYVGRHERSESADVLTGFPTSRSDVRELVWGAFGATYAGGAARLLFECVDGAHHTRISIQIEDADARQSASFIAVVEPAGIDNFVPQLKCIEQQLS
ncbi:MAG: hypothetical protein V4587_02055 [Acidobacteriota bacterium]